MELRLIKQRFGSIDDRLDIRRPAYVAGVHQDKFLPDPKLFKKRVFFTRHRMDDLKVGPVRDDVDMNIETGRLFAISLSCHGRRR